MIDNYIIGAAVGYLSNFLYDISRNPIKTKFGSRSDGKIVSLSEFYDDPDIQKIGTKVKIRGTFSNYIPLIPGRARQKRDFHLELRRNIEGIKDLFNHQNKKIYDSTINYLLSLSAGQMVLRVPKTDSLYVPCAIYESIARNSVFLLAAREVYDEINYKLTCSNAINNNFAEMEIEGEVYEFENLFLNNIRQLILEMKGVSDLLDLNKLECLMETKALFLRKGAAKISYLGPPRFLDGDIWLAIKSNNNEELITRFLNLSSKEEISEQCRSIVDELKSKYPEWKVIGAFDSCVEQFI